jgi:hypothetical protein
MRAIIKRFVIYFVTSFSLVYLTNVAQNALHSALLNAGFTDTLTLGGLIDLVSDLPFFTSVQADVFFAVLGIIGWLLILRDRRTEDGRSNAVRAGFLTFLTALFGIRILLSAMVIVRNVDTLAQSSIPIAAQLAAVGAWGLALGLTLLEWSRGRPFNELGQKWAKFFALAGQWAILVMGVWALAQTVQSALQSVIAPLPLCSPELNIFAQLVAFISRLTQQCTDTPPFPGALLTTALLIGAFALYTWWANKYKHDTTGLDNADAVVGALIAGLVVTFNSVLAVRFIWDRISQHPGAVFPQSLLSTPGSIDIASYPFAGPLVAGLVVTALYFWREKRREREEKDSYGLMYGIMMLAFPLGAVFFVGACMLLGHVFVALLNHFGFTEVGVTSDDWVNGLMLLIPGLLWGAILWRDLQGMGKGMASVSVPGRTYVVAFYVGTLGATVLSVIGLIALVVTWLLGTPIDPTNSVWARLVAIIIVMAPFARYYYNITRRW